MKDSTILSSTDDDIRARVLQLAGASGCVASCFGPWLTEDDALTLFVLLLAWLHVGLSRTLEFPVTPDMLPHLGWPGRLLHRLFCRRAGTWGALQSLTELLSDLPSKTSTCEGNVRLHSRPERWAYRELVGAFGDTNVTPHPLLPGGASGKERADFYVTAVAGSSIWVEVAMVTAQADAFETRVLADYRTRFLKKLALYKALGIEPVIIWGDEAASPRALAGRLNEIRIRLGLPAQPPAPPAWYEGGV